MAAPVITSVLEPVTLNPSGSIDIVIEAHDPDSSSGSISFPVTDSQGNVSMASLSLTVEDPLDFGAAVADGVNVTIQRIAVTATSATYRITAV